MRASPAFLYIVCTTSLLAVACGNEETGARPEPSRAIVSDQDLIRFEAAGVPVHRGLTPPDARGSYLNDSVSTLGPGSARPCGMQQALTPDGPDTVRRTVTFTGARCPRPQDDPGLFISGAGDCFTIYRRAADADAPGGCTTTTIDVISACVRPTGLVDYREGFSDLTHDGPGCASMVDHGRLMAVGGMVVVTEKDGLVARLN
jgi:hypothetical protein